MGFWIVRNFAAERVCGDDVFTVGNIGKVKTNNFISRDKIVVEKR